jgi:acyl-coenzyme A synthetase/AMP-(fatty) acid ligase
MLVGRPCGGIDVRLADAEGALTGTAPRLGPRRVLVRGDRVAHDRARPDADGWLDTGDLGTIDDEGRIWLLGRAANAGPAGLAPAEVEEPVMELEGVRAAALVIVPGGDRRRLTLAVQPATNATGEDVRACVESMAVQHGWGLDRVALVGRLPRDARTGKIDYQRLRAQIG